MLTLIDAVLLSFLAFFVGIVSALVGVGGGVFVVPFLSLVFGFSVHGAVGTSLAVIVFTSLSSALGYSRQRRIDYKIGLILAFTSVPGAFLGAYLTTFISTGLLGLIFGFFLIFVAFQMMFQPAFFRFRSPAMRGGWHRRIVDSEGMIFEYDARVISGLALSFFGGLSSGLLGIGGGSVMVPILYFTMSVPMHVTVATSMFIMIFTSVSGVVTHISIGNIRFDYAIYLCIGVIFGAQLGAHIAKRISGKNLRRIFGLVLFLVSINMILKYI